MASALLWMRPMRSPLTSVPDSSSWPDEAPSRRARRRERESTRGQTIAIVVALAVGVYASWVVLRPLLGVLTWSVVVTVLFYPVHRRIEERLGTGVRSALLSTTLIVFTILIPTGLVVTATVAEVRDMSEGMPVTLGEWLSPSNPTTGRAVQLVERVISLDRWRDPDTARETLEGWSSGVATGSMRVLGGAVAVVVQMALVVFTTFFMLKDARPIRTSLYEMVPIENRRLRELFVRTRDVIRASVYGTLLLAVIQGGLGGLAFLVLGLPSPFLWGLVMTLASIVPVLGAFVVWVPAAVHLVIAGEVWKALALAAWGTVVIGMADNVLRPVLVGNRTRMHELLVFFGVLGGIKAFGALGVVIGPVIFAVTLALVQALREVGAPEPLPADKPVAP